MQPSVRDEVLAQFIVICNAVGVSGDKQIAAMTGAATRAGGLEAALTATEVTEWKKDHQTLVAEVKSDPDRACNLAIKEL